MIRSAAARFIISLFAILCAGAQVIPAVYAQEIALDGAVSQGGLVQGTIRPGARLTLDGRKIRVSRSGVFVIGFGYPVVPEREARLRVQISAAHEREHIDGLVSALKKL